MCSVNGGEDIEDLNKSIKLLKFNSKFISSKCNKCKEEKPSILLRNKDVYCKICFLNSTVHKYKALLGKHKLIRDNDKVLIYYEGGHSSTSMLSFIRNSLDLDTPKKCRFIPIAIFIEENFHLQKNERLNLLKDVSEELKSFNIPLHFTSLTDYYKDLSSDNIFLTDNLNELNIEEDNAMMLLNNEDSEFLTNDIKAIYKKKLLIGVAKQLNCKYIFTSELSTDVASQLLINVALGRGAHIPLDAGFCDNRDEEVTILRPLRNFDIKELALYNHFNNLNPIIIPKQSNNVKKSLQNTIEQFINDLQSNFPATVTTVLKTGDKLGIQSKKKENMKICSLCKGTVDISTHNITSEDAIVISQKVSTNLGDIENISRQNDETTCFSCSKIKPFLIA